MILSPPWSGDVTGPGLFSRARRPKALRRCAPRLGATVRGRLACLLIAEKKLGKFVNSELFLT